MQSTNHLIKSMLIGLAVTLFTVPVHAEQSDSKAKLNEMIKSCGVCHGSDGNSPNSTIPSIAGMTAQFFKHTMDGYKNDGRKSVLMKNYIHSLSDADLDMIADYYEAQKFIPRQQEFDRELAIAGEKLHNKYCEKCHENGGRITENNYGVLAGQWMPYLKKSIQDYIDKNRNVNPMMIKKLELLNEEAGEKGIDQLIHYYASQK